LSKDEYKANRDRVFAIMGLDPSDPNYSCHHEVIYRREAKKNPELRKDLDKIENLFPLSDEQHERLHHLEDEVTGYHQDLPIKRRHHGKRNRH